MYNVYNPGGFHFYVILISCFAFFQVVYKPPPWTLQDVLQCLKKHWIAVFGQVVQRKKLQLVLNLIDFFQSSKLNFAA